MIARVSEPWVLGQPSSPSEPPALRYCDKCLRDYVATPRTHKAFIQLYLGSSRSHETGSCAVFQLSRNPYLVCQKSEVSRKREQFLKNLDLGLFSQREPGLLPVRRL